MLAKVRSKLLHSSDINIILLVYQGLFSSLYWQLTLLSRTPKCAIDFYSQLFSMALFTSRESNKTLQYRRWEAGNLLLFLPPSVHLFLPTKGFFKAPMSVSILVPRSLSNPKWFIVENFLGGVTNGLALEEISQAMNSKWNFDLTHFGYSCHCCHTSGHKNVCDNCHTALCHITHLIYRLLQTLISFCH